MSHAGDRYHIESIDRYAGYSEARERIVAKYGAANLRDPSEQLVTNPECEP